MYRRRQNRSVQMNNEQQQQQNKVEEKPQVQAQTIQEYHEPVIKATVSHVPPKKLVESGRWCQMINTLRNIDYFSKTGVKSISFGDMVDTILSEHYLNLNKGVYAYEFKKTQDNKYEPDETKIVESSATEATILPSQMYTQTKNYERKTFVAGDVIFGKSENITVAFLITRVYDGSGKQTTSVLDLNPPVGADTIVENDDEYGVRLSTFSDVEGNVYAFAWDVKLSDLIAAKYKPGDSVDEVQDLVSKENGEYVKLIPTNQSKDAENAKPSNRTATLSKSAQYPDAKYFPISVQGDEEKQNQFNLSTGVIVDGWLIYMYDTNEVGVEKADPSKFVGDVIKTGPISITTISSSTIQLGETFRYPFSIENSFEHKGNSLQFASEPLNSQHYQANFNDTQGIRSLTLNESNIYTLTCFTKAPVDA